MCAESTQTARLLPAKRKQACEQLSTTKKRPAKQDEVRVSCRASFELVEICQNTQTSFKEGSS
jgi:hypothetical protein